MVTNERFNKSPKFLEGPNILILSEQQYLFGTSLFKAQNNSICKKFWGNYPLGPLASPMHRNKYKEKSDM